MTNDRWTRLIGLPLSINKFTENDQWSMSSTNRPTTTIDCTYTSTSIHCTVTIDFNTTGSVPIGPVLSVLPMVCLYRLKNCCLKMWQCKSLCKLLLLLTALWLHCLASRVEAANIVHAYNFVQLHYFQYRRPIFRLFLLDFNVNKRRIYLVPANCLPTLSIHFTPPRNLLRWCHYAPRSNSFTAFAGNQQKRSRNSSF